MKKRNKKLSKKILTAIPVFNEYQYIEKIVSAVREFSDDILVIDDGSIDGCERWIANCDFVQKLVHDSNMGYGQSIIDAIEYAHLNGYQWLITMDCDHQHEPKCIAEFYREIEKNEYDIISGSRYLAVEDKGSVAAPKERVAINKQITKILNQRFGLNITDAFCGFKAYRVCSAIKLELTEKGYAMPLQLWIQAARENFKIKEISVPLIYHDAERNFAGQFENSTCRLNYYMQTILREINGYEN